MIIYLIIALLVFLSIFLAKERQELLGKLGQSNESATRYREMWYEIKEKFNAQGLQHFNIDKEHEWMRSQLMTVRAGQGQENGWEVCAYIPESLIKWLSAETTNPEERGTFVRCVAENLVRKAISGCCRVDKMGKVTALVFEPITIRKGEPFGPGIDGDKTPPKWVQVLFDKNSNWKMSPKVWESGRSSEEIEREFRGY